MKLRDILEKKVPDLKIDKSDIPDFNLNYMKKIGSIDQIIVYQSSYFGYDYATFVIFDDKKEAISFIVVKSNSDQINGEEYHQVVRVWTRPDNKGKGYVTRLHIFVLKKLGFKLMSDFELTNDGETLYKNIVTKKKIYPISFFNSKTKEITKDEPMDLWNLDNDWLILMEENLLSKPEMFGHKSGYGYLREMIRVGFDEACV